MSAADAERAKLAFNAGRAARARNHPRKCPHNVEFLRAAWYEGYDQKAKQAERKERQ